MKNRIWVSLSLFMLFPIIIVSVYLFVVYCNNVKTDYENRIRDELRTAAYTINREYSLYVHKSKYIYLNSFVVSGIKGSSEFDPISTYEFQNYMRSLTQDLDFSDAKTRAFTFYLEDYNYNSYYLADFDELDGYRPGLIERMLEAPSNEELWSDGLKTDSAGKKYVTFYRNVSSAVVMPCILEVNIPYQDIADVLSVLKLPPSAKLAHYTPAGTVLHGGAGADTGGKTIEVRSDELLDGSVLSVAFPKRILYAQYTGAFFVMLGALAALAVLIVFASKTTSNRITASLAEFVSYLKLNNIRGEYGSVKDDALGAGDMDEISMIKRKFVNILNTMNETFEDLMAAKGQNNELQLKLLHARLNPHLLYNSLSAIKWFALRNKDQRTAELIDSMTFYYRAALNEGEETIRVTDELNLIREYVNIMQYTNTYPYTLTFEVEQGIMNVFIPVHLLQPAVENAILHGLKKKQDGKLTIRGSQSDGFLVFEVEDNGSGMSDETIEEVLSLRFRKSRGGYGVKNLILRVRHYFGEPCGVAIESTEGEGTRFIIRIRELRIGGEAVETKEL